jgi:hypothetical protein
MLLPLGKSILPVIMEELSKAGLTVDAKVYNNRVGIMLGEVTEPFVHLDHFLPPWGLDFIKVAHPCPFRILRLALFRGL